MSRSSSSLTDASMGLQGYNITLEFLKFFINNTTLRSPTALIRNNKTP